MCVRECVNEHTYTRANSTRRSLLYCMKLRFASRFLAYSLLSLFCLLPVIRLWGKRSHRFLPHAPSGYCIMFFGGRSSCLNFTACPFMNTKCLLFPIRSDLMALPPNRFDLGTIIVRISSHCTHLCVPIARGLTVCLCTRYSLCDNSEFHIKLRIVNPR